MLNIYEQRIHQDEYLGFLGKLREIPIKIKFILSIHNVYAKLIENLDFIS